jgi:hypothetical protein
MPERLSDVKTFIEVKRTKADTYNINVATSALTYQ